MSRRERLEARAEKREQWAAGRATKAAAAWDAGDLREERSGIPLGQPVLVGHHSERRHRRAIDKAHAAMDRAVEHEKKASQHAQAARTLRSALDRPIFSDDDDAIAKLEEKAAKLDEQAERANAINKSWRRAYKNNHGDIDATAADVAALYSLSEKTRDALAADARRFSCTRERGPMAATHERAEARRCRQRIEEIKRRTAAKAKAKEVGGATIRGGEYVAVTFAEYPGRPMIAALKAAGFHWSAPNWHGRRDALPADVVALAVDLGVAQREDVPPAIAAIKSAIQEKIAILVAGMRSEEGRNPLCELRGADGNTAKIVDWSGPLADFIEEADDAVRWSAETWQGIAKLSRGPADVYLGGGATPLVVLRRVEGGA